MKEKRYKWKCKYGAYIFQGGKLIGEKKYKNEIEMLRDYFKQELNILRREV